MLDQYFTNPQVRQEFRRLAHHPPQSWAHWFFTQSLRRDPHPPPIMRAMYAERALRMANNLAILLNPHSSTRRWFDARRQWQFDARLY